MLRYSRRRRTNQVAAGAAAVSSNRTNGNPSVEPYQRSDFVRFNGNLKGLIVDEEGLDVLYWRKLEGEVEERKFNKDEFEGKEEEKKVISRLGSRSKKYKPPIQETPLLRGKSSSSHIWPAEEDEKLEVRAVPKQELSTPLSSRSPPPLPSPPPMISSSPPPPTPLMIPVKTSPAPPPPPPKKVGSVATSLKPPPAPKGLPNDNKKEVLATSSDQGMVTNEKGQVKMKPLHWDKVNPNAEHSMVWDKVNGGSFR